MNLHTKKAVAPIIITVIVILWILGYGYSIYIIRPAWTYILIGFVALLALIGVMIAMLVERMKEIRSGEEDDLSKY